MIHHGKKNWILLSESRQNFFELFAMHKAEMTLVNFEKDVRKEVIKLCFFLITGILEG